MTVTGVKQESVPPPGSLVRRIGGDLVGFIALPGRAARRLATSAPMLPTAWLVLTVLAAAALIGASMLMVDGWAYAQAKRLPIWVIDVFNRITDLGKSGWFLWPVGIGIIILAALAATMQRQTRLTLVTLVVRLEFIFVAIALPGLITTTVKHFIGRVRPSAMGPFAYVPFSWRPDYAGMPSGHATTAFAVAVALGAIWPRARPLLWLYALVIALSRVVISAHYVSDVIAGAFIGGFVALLVSNYFAARRLGLAAGHDGSVHVLPVPSLRRIKSTAARLVARA